MKLRTAVAIVACGIGCAGLVYAFQRPFKEYPGLQNRGLPLPPDWREPAEWVFGRLAYPPAFGGGGRRRFGGFGGGGGYGGGYDWSQGMSTWTIDYPTCERHFTQAL